MLGGKIQSIGKAQDAVGQGNILLWDKTRRVYWMKPEIAAAVLALLGDEAN